MESEYLDPSKQPPNIIFHDGKVGGRPFLSGIRWEGQWIVTPHGQPGVRVVGDEDITELTYLGCEVATPDRCDEWERTHARFNCRCY